MARDMLGLIAVFNLHDVYFALFVLSDSLAQSLFMGFVYFLVSALKNREPHDFVLTFALLTLATFVRPGSLFLPFFVIAGILTVGDWIRSPDRNIEGVVEEIGWRMTRIRTFEIRPL